MNHTYSALNMTMENNEQAAKAAEKAAKEAAAENDLQFGE